MNLLDDPLFSVTTDADASRLSLPQLLEGLGEDRLTSLTRVRRHQADHVHMFLCYIAAAALARAGAVESKQPAEFWRRALVQLAAGDADAFCMVRDDPCKPAFMQPPVASSEQLQRFAEKARSPDELDILVTSKNHDVKQSTFGGASLEAWAYALVTLQTATGFLGQGNYGVVRMNGGFGSRPCVGLLAGESPGQRFKRDVQVLLASRPSLLAGAWQFGADGHVLLWCVPWDGGTPLTLSDLDPFFIEVARLVRLVGSDASFVAMGCPSKARRVDAAVWNGAVGDPWIPLSQTKGKGAGRAALTVGPAGLTPQLLRALLFADGYEPAAMQLPLADDRSAARLTFYAAVLAGGQGQTAGFHEARVLIPAHARALIFGAKDGRDRLATLSQRFLDDAGAMQNKVLGMAMTKLLEGGRKELDLGKVQIGQWRLQAMDAYHRRWAGDYFPTLWEVADQVDDEAAQRIWQEKLRDAARAVLNGAIESAPRTTGRRYRAVVMAESMFNGSLYKNFPLLRVEHDRDGNNIRQTA